MLYILAADTSALFRHLLDAADADIRIKFDRISLLDLAS